MIGLESLKKAFEFGPIRIRNYFNDQTYHAFGWRTRSTLVMSLRIILCGATRKKARTNPATMRRKKATYVPSLTLPSLLFQFCPIGMADPMTAPRLKMAQKIPIYRPFCDSMGYDIITVPCAVHKQEAQIPRIAPDAMTKPALAV